MIHKECLLRTISRHTRDFQPRQSVLVSMYFNQVRTGSVVQSGISYVHSRYLRGVQYMSVLLCRVSPLSALSISPLHYNIAGDRLTVTEVSLYRKRQSICVQKNMAGAQVVTIYCPFMLPETLQRNCRERNVDETRYCTIMQLNTVNFS